MMVRGSFNLDDALLDPSRAFGTPEKVLSDPRLDRRAKESILERWREDCERLEATEKTAAIGGADNLQRVLKALNRLKSSA
ncbi:MAG: hypothetical protein GEU92_02935 [Alphaproteobacteria bacterium]|nr:hypothetical protein [Alphaproteobacteria bacterium]